MKKTVERESGFGLRRNFQLPSKYAAGLSLCQLACMGSRPLAETSGVIQSPLPANTFLGEAPQGRRQRIKAIRERLPRFFILKIENRAHYEAEIVIAGRHEIFLLGYGTPRIYAAKAHLPEVYIDPGLAEAAVVVMGKRLEIE